MPSRSKTWTPSMVVRECPRVRDQVHGRPVAEGLAHPPSVPGQQNPYPRQRLDAGGVVVEHDVRPTALGVVIAAVERTVPSGDSHLSVQLPVRAAW